MTFVYIFFSSSYHLNSITIFQTYVHSKKHIIWDVKARFKKKDGQLFATHSITISTFSSSNGISDTKSIGPLMTTPLFFYQFYLAALIWYRGVLYWNGRNTYHHVHPLKVPRLSNSPSFSLPRGFFLSFGEQSYFPCGVLRGFEEMPKNVITYYMDDP